MRCSWRFAAGALAMLVLLLGVPRANAEEFVLRGAAQGTTYTIKFVAGSAPVDVHRLHADVEGILADIDRQMSTYRPDSELSRFNRAGAGEWFPVSAATAQVVAAAQKISEKTGGALDVTIGPLVRLWHFGPPAPTGDHARSGFRPPPDEAINAAQQHVGYQRLQVRHDPPALRKLVERLEVDLNSIAPGYTVDRLAALFVESGIDNVLIELGGEVRAVGRRTDGKPWRVAITRPTAGRRELQKAIPLEHAGLATSGDYEKFFEYAGRRYSHIIDPTTGRPVEHALASVTVVADECITGDAWSTALLVMGPQRGYGFAEEHGIAALFISRGDGDGVETSTSSAWRARFGEETYSPRHAGEPPQ